MKCSGYCFYMNTNVQRDFQICISVPLNEGDKFRECYSCLKIIVQAHLHVVVVVVVLQNFSLSVHLLNDSIYI